MLVSIQVGAPKEVFAAIKSEWQTLFSEVGGSPFLSWEWMSVWFDSFGKCNTPVILKAFAGNQLIGILPMVLKNDKAFGMNYNHLSMMGSGPGGADNLDVIASPTNKRLVASAIVEFLQNESICHQLRLENIPANSETIDVLRTIDRHGSFPRFAKKRSHSCPQIDLGDGWEPVLDRSRRKSNFIRKLKRLEKMPGFEYRTITASAETSAAFQRFLLLHEKRWEKAGGSELSGHPRLVEFQRQIVENLCSAGLIRFEELWVEGACRASIYGLDDGKTFYYYNSGYDLDFSRLSVGLVLLGLSIKATISRGNNLYDFLRGDEAYKFDWSNRFQDLVILDLSSNAFPLVAKELVRNGLTGIQNYSKALLPESTKETIGNWRRAWKRNYLLSER